MDRRVARKEAMKDDTALLKNALNAVVEKIHISTSGINGEISRFSTGLEAIDENLRALSGQMNRQMQMLHTCTESMETIAASVGDTDASIKLVLQDTGKTYALSTGGAQNLRQATQQMGDIFDSTQKVSDLSVQLNRRCGQIEGILKSIEEISMQTTILSLNASVEAARAGAHGKGFAVVASSIKQLAATTARAVSDIEGLLQGMKTDTADMTGRSQLSLEQVKTGQKQVADTDLLFQKIVDSIQNIQAQSNAVLQHSGRVIGELQQINGQIQAANLFFQETAESTARVAGLVGEKSEASKEMVKELRRLNEETHALTVNVLENLEDSEAKQELPG